jgi:hypothetical protein
MRFAVKGLGDGPRDCLNTRCHQVTAQIVAFSRAAKHRHNLPGRRNQLIRLIAG